MYHSGLEFMLENFIKTGKLSDRELSIVRKEIESYRDKSTTALVGYGQTKESLTPTASENRIGKTYFPKVIESPRTYNIIQSIVLAEYAGSGLDVSEPAEAQFASYSSGGKFDWHQDILPSGRLDKKLRGLTFTVNISDSNDYFGGEFLLKVKDEEVIQLDRTAGSYMVFPSFMFHQASVVGGGTRESMVFWIYLTVDEIARLRKYA